MDNKTSLAFPHTFTYGKSTTIHFGLTKREYFAALAMQGVLSHESFFERMCSEGGDNRMINKVSVAAVNMADALLQELSKEK